MFIVKGRLLGTVLALLIAALGATMLSGEPGSDEPVTACAPSVAGTALAAAR